MIKVAGISVINVILCNDIQRNIRCIVSCQNGPVTQIQLFHGKEEQFYNCNNAVMLMTMLMLLLLLLLLLLLMMMMMMMVMMMMMMMMMIMMMR